MDRLPATIDVYGRRWNVPSNEVCQTCGQPDNCGDCNHVPLTDEQAHHLGVLTIHR
jgi:hypothetical protein